MKSQPIRMFIPIFFSILMTHCTKKHQGPSDLSMAPLGYQPGTTALQCDGRNGKQHTRTILHPLKPRKTYLQQKGTYNEDRPLKVQWKNNIIMETSVGIHNKMIYSHDQTYEQSSCSIIPKVDNPSLLQYEKTLIIPKNLGEKFAGTIEGTSGIQYLRFHIKKLVSNGTGYLLHGFFEDDTIVVDNKTLSATKNVDDNSDLSLLDMLAVDSPVYGEKVAETGKKSNLDMMGFTPQRHYGWVERMGLGCDSNNTYIFKDSLRKMIVLKVSTIP